MFKKTLMDISDFKKIIKKFSSLEDLIFYIHSYYEKLIKTQNNQKVKDKYIKVRNSMLAYIATNKQSIILELSKK
jgi:hypothetical protein